MLVPIRPDDPTAAANRAAWAGLQQFTRPYLCAFSDADPITGGADRVLRKLIPGCANQPPHHDHRRPFPPGGQRARTRRGRGRLHRRHLLIPPAA